MTEQRQYTSHEVASAAGITYRQLDYWIRNDVLWPEAGKDVGSGTPRTFDERELTIAQVCGALRGLGVDLATLKSIAHSFRFMSSLELTGRWFIDVDGSVTRDPCDACWSLDLSALVLATTN